MCKWCKLHLDGVFFYMISARSRLFFTTNDLSQILTAVFQVKVTGSRGQANIAWLSESGLKQKKQPLFLLVDQDRSHMVQQCVTHTEACRKPVMHCAGPLWHSTYAFILGYSRKYPYCMFLEHSHVWTEPMTLAVFMWYSGLQALQNIFVQVYMCVSVCLAKRVRCFTVAATKGGRQRKPRPQRGWKWEYLFGETLHTPQLCTAGEDRDTLMSHFMGRHQLTSVCKDAKYTSTGTFAYINLCVCVCERDI